MNKTLRETLSLKCKDMGLTEKALDELAKLGSEGLTEETSKEDIEKKADFLVPFAKAMQGEITRKTRKTPPTSEPQPNGDGSKGEGENNGGNEMPEWAKSFKAQLDALQKENNDLKAEKTKSERAAEIAAKAKALGIPDILIKRVSIADDADIDKELAEYKQELVNNSLVPKGQAHEPGGTAEQMKADALAWAKTLPDK